MRCLQKFPAIKITFSYKVGFVFYIIIIRISLSYIFCNVLTLLHSVYNYYMNNIRDGTGTSTVRCKNYGLFYQEKNNHEKIKLDKWVIGKSWLPVSFFIVIYYSS
jgi:hypothetical protein